MLKSNGQSNVFLGLITLVLLAVFWYLTYPLTYINTNKDLGYHYYHVMEIVNSHCSESQYNNPLKKIVTFTKFKDDTLAECGTTKGMYTIRVDESKWDASPYNEREQLMIHELIHCLFNENHSNDPSSLMYPYLFPMTIDQLYAQLNDYLVTKCKN